MNKWTKLKQNIGFTDIGMGIPYEAPTSFVLLLFCSPPPHVSQQLLRVCSKGGFLPLKWRTQISSLLSLQLFLHSFFPNQVSRNKAGL